MLMPTPTEYCWFYNRETNSIFPNLEQRLVDILQPFSNQTKMQIPTHLDFISSPYQSWGTLKQLCIGRNISRDRVIEIARILRGVPRHFFSGGLRLDYAHWLGLAVPGYEPPVPLAVQLPYIFWRLQFGAKHGKGGMPYPDTPLVQRFVAFYAKYAFSTDLADRELFCKSLPNSMNLMELLCYLNQYAADDDVNNGGAMLTSMAGDDGFECHLLGKGGTAIMYAGCSLTRTGPYRGWTVNT